MTEIYKDIKDYEGLYQVSNLGNVKSLPKGDGNGNRERTLKPETIKRNNTSYQRVTLSKEGTVTRYQLHRLVAEYFIDNPDNKPMVNHIDNDGLNNSVDNLEWCTHSENMVHAQKQGRLTASQSKGGSTSGALQRAKQNQIHEARVGTKVGHLLISSYYLCTDRVKPRTVYVCKCDCGNTVEKIPYNLFNNSRLQMCNQCSYKSRRKQDEDIVSTT